MSQARNTDKWPIAVIGLIQEGIVLLGTAAAVVSSKKLYEPPVPKGLQHLADYGLLLGILPLIWVAITAWLASSARSSGIARMTAIVVGVALCVMLFALMCRYTLGYIVPIPW